MALKTKPKGGFTYKPRSADQVKGRANRSMSNFDSIYKPGFDNYRSKVGDNMFRYLPPTWDDADHYGYTIFVHFGVGAKNSSYLCLAKMLNKPCPCCEAAKEAKDAGETEEAQALKSNERIVSWVLDRDGDDPEKPLLFDQSWTQDRDITSLCVNERTGEILMIDHPDKGFDVSFKKTGTGLKTKYYGYQIARDASPIHDSEKAQDEILEYVKENPVPDVLNFYDYEYLAGMLSGAVPEKDAAVDKDEDDGQDERSSVRSRGAKDEPARSSTARRRAEPVDKTDEEEPPFETSTRRGPRRDQEEEDVVEEVQPRRSAKRPEPVDEEVDEEAEETVPVRRGATAAPARTNGRTRVIEDVVDEEDEPPARPAARSSVRR